jgi:glycerophosphoryl diester phosphodiesterase
MIQVFPALRVLREQWRPLMLVHLSFTMLGLMLFAPLFGATLQGLLTLSGNAALADQDIALLLLSPLGLALAIVLVGLLLAIAALELGAIQTIAQGAQHSLNIAPLDAVRFSLRHALPLFQLTIGLTLRVLVYLLPFLAALAAIAWWLLGDYDINYYLSHRPAQFYYALLLALPLLLLLVWLLGRRLLGWSLALPLVLFTDTPASAAFASSEQLTLNKRGELLGAFARWVLLVVLMSLIPLLFLSGATAIAVSSPQQNLSILVVLLGGTMLVWSFLSVLVAAFNLGSFAFVVATAFERYKPTASATVLRTRLRERKIAIGARWSRGQVAAALLLATALSVTAGLWLLQSIQLDDRVLIIAHRGAAGAAPENTLASVRRALDDGADWVEIDVQETSDGQVVVVHDSDFMKLAGNPLKVWEGSVAEVQQIDIGSWFDPRFADQRVPTLQQVLEEIKGRSKLVIELKYYGHDQLLEQRVVDIVEATGMADDVVAMSLQLQGISKLQALRPDWTAGLLAATAVGDLSRLDVDFLAVNQNMANRAFIRRAHAAGKQVFVWTINDALSLSRWMSMGVDGVITDEPALARKILEQRAKMSSTERLVLSAALFFGSPDVASKYRDNSP